MPEATTPLHEAWNILKESGGRYYLILGFIAFLAGVSFYSLGTIDYAIYTGFVGLAVALGVVGLTEVRFYLQGQKLDSIEQKLEALRKFEEEHHPK